MKILEKPFNQSVNKELNSNYKFDRHLLDMRKSTNQTFYLIFLKLSDINDVYFEERETKDDVLDKKKINYISEIFFKDIIWKSLKNHKKNVNMSKWLGKELLYLFRKKFDYLKFNYM